MNPFIVITVYGLGIFIFLVLLAIVIAKRIDEKKSEDFEKREN